MSIVAKVHVSGGHWAPVDRERLCIDIANTGVIAALVGGFALSNLQGHMMMEEQKHELLPVLEYLLSVIAVHMCTCASVTSALVYRSAVYLDDDKVKEWTTSMPWRWLIPMPIMKFAAGCSCCTCHVHKTTTPRRETHYSRTHTLTHAPHGHPLL